MPLLASSGYPLLVRSSNSSSQTTYSAIFYGSAHACALKCCDVAKKAFINRLFRPQAILSLALSPGTEKTPGPKFSNPDHFFEKNWSGGPKFSIEKLVPDQIFQRTKISVTVQFGGMQVLQGSSYTETSTFVLALYSKHAYIVS